MITRFANPRKFLKLADRAIPIAAIAATVLLTAGLYMSLISSPLDYQQGESVRIMYVHVPAAWMAMMIYLWIAVALASLLSLDSVWHRDHDDGTFDLLLLSPVSPLAVVFAKITAHWLASGVLLTVASIIVSQMLFVPLTALPVLIVSLLLGTLYISLLGGLGAVLTFGARRPGLLLALLILPLFIPMLILGAAVGEAALAGLPCSAYLLLQASLSLGALALVPPAAAAFLKLHMRSS